MDRLSYFVDREGVSHFISDMTMSASCMKAGNWFKRFKPRVCYIQGNRLFLAKDWELCPYDMIDLLDRDIKVFGKQNCVIVIKGCSTSKYKRYRLKFHVRDYLQWLT